MKTIIIGGGDIDPAFLKKVLDENKEASIIAADRGAEALYLLGRKPHYLLGDFDSASPQVKNALEKAGADVTVYPAVKDFTDSEAALIRALELGSSEILLLGMTGGRLDHFMANVHNLLIPFRKGVRAWMLDPQNCITLIGTEYENGQESKGGKSFAVTEFSKPETFGKYVSILPLFDRTEGVTLTGFKYPLKKATVTKGTSLCVSNEITEEKAVIEIEKGVMILTLSKDRG